jgi:hypothetical protein
MLIQNFYTNKIVAIIGVHTLVGKFLINKIVSTLSHIQKIYFIFYVKKYTDHN